MIVPAARALPSLAWLPLHWVLVEGPTGEGPLWWSATPVTYTQIGMPELGASPVTRLTRDEAGRIAASLGARLPRSAEWKWMAAGPHKRPFPWGEEDWGPDLANLRPAGHGRVLAVGSYPRGATPDGLLDVAGNVWEWTATVAPGGGAVIRGGSYNSPPRYATCSYRNEVPDSLRSPGIGLRVVWAP